VHCSAREQNSSIQRAGNNGLHHHHRRAHALD